MAVMKVQFQPLGRQPQELLWRAEFRQKLFAAFGRNEEAGVGALLRSWWEFGDDVLRNYRFGQ